MYNKSDKLVVSVEPAMIEDIFPIRESGPWVNNISFRIIILEDDDIGLKIAKGIISFGNKLMLINDIKSFNKLLLTRTVTDMIMANIDGKISRLIFNPSFTPSRNSS